MKSKILLNRLLQVLVDEWGHAEVKDSLASLTTDSLGSSINFTLSNKRRLSTRKARLNGIVQIERMELDQQKKEILLGIAERYEHKQFLPSVADVREFLIMMGQKPTGMKDRSDAFRVLTKNLALLPIDRLIEISQSSLHSGPSSLGPLSDAISAASGKLGRQGQQAPLEKSENVEVATENKTSQSSKLPQSDELAHEPPSHSEAKTIGQHVENVPEDQRTS